jgi:hypothetical protein
MTCSKQFDITIRKFGYGALFLLVLLLTTVSLVKSQEDKKIETIDATAAGTSTQLGTMVNIKVTIASPRCSRSAALPSTARWATTSLTFA